MKALFLLAALAVPARAVDTDVVALGAVGVVGASSFFIDQPVRDWLKDTGAWFGADNTLFEFMGSYGAIATPAVFYVAGSAFHSDREKKIGVVGYEALAAQGLVVGGLKLAAGRERPAENDGPGRWNPLGGSPGAKASFPSGHTGAAFSVAAVVSEAYDNPWVSVAGYGLAAGVGVGRIVSDHHWFSDVVFGGVMGYAAGKLAWKFETRKGWAKKLYTDGRGLYFADRF